MKASTGNPALGTGYTEVASEVSCVLTRFRVRSAWSIVRFYLAYRKIKRSASRADGLIATLFLIEDPRTYYTLSLWRDAEALLEFNTRSYAHISAANGCFGHLKFGPTGAELWSAQFQLCAISPHNLRWPGVDLETNRARHEADHEQIHVAC